jgi:hypothetical protein
LSGCKTAKGSAEDDEELADEELDGTCGRDGGCACAHEVDEDRDDDKEDAADEDEDEDEDEDVEEKAEGK